VAAALLEYATPTLAVAVGVANEIVGAVIVMLSGPDVAVSPY
jgi:hypothetical protein